MVITGLVLNSVVGVTSADDLGARGRARSLRHQSVARRAAPPAVWGLPPLFLLWANMDAGFAAGLLIVLAALLLIPRAGARAQGAGASSPSRSGSALLLCLPIRSGLASTRRCSPGSSIPGVAQSLAGFGSPNFHDWWARLFEAEVLLVIVLWSISGGPDRFSAVTGFGLLVATLFAQENLGLFAVFMAPQLAIHGSRAWTGTWPRASPGGRSSGRATSTPRDQRDPLAMTAAMAVALVPRLSTSAAAAYQATTYPEAAATYAGTNSRGRRVYTLDTWGGYLAYRFPSGRVVFLYDEPAVFGNAALKLYDAIDRARSQLGPRADQREHSSRDPADGCSRGGSAARPRMDGRTATTRGAAAS